MKRLRDAVEALAKRKVGVMQPFQTQTHGVVGDKDDKLVVHASGGLTTEQYSQLLVGFDITMDELNDEGQHYVPIIKRTLVNMVSSNKQSPGDALTTILQSTWMDGILTGIMLSELRKNEDD